MASRRCWRSTSRPRCESTRRMSSTTRASSPNWTRAASSTIRSKRRISPVRPRPFAVALAAAVACLAAVGVAQNVPAPGKSLGRISTQGELIVFELDEGALGQSNLFDLARQTLRFTPENGGYRVERTAFAWDADFGGQAPPRTPVSLHNFSFPFSGTTWDALAVDTTGSIGFGSGVTIGRFDQLQKRGKALAGEPRAICVYMKPRMNGPHYVKELADRVVITWTLSEPAGGIQD